ncbi:MAG: hypothetical protein Q9159_000898 [Coniocarpon cinnabarinum]
MAPQLLVKLLYKSKSNLFPSNTDEISALVLDPGYSVVRAGFAGEDTPKSVVPTYYGRKPGSSGPLFGDNAVHNPFSGLEIHNPMNEDGVVEDWDIASKLWEYAITSRLTGHHQTPAIRNGLNDDPKEGENGEDMKMEDVEQHEKSMTENPLIVTEPGWNPTKNREKIMEIAMEEWGVPAFFLARSGVMAAFASGKPSALVIDLGAANTAITPVYDGMMLKKGALHSPLAGNYLSDQIRLLFQQTQPPTPLTPHYTVASKTTVEAGQPAQATYRTFTDPQPSPSFRRLQEDRVLSEFKESVVQVWDPARGNGQSLSQAQDLLRQSEGRPFEMPDGYNNVFGAERYRPAESLFDEKSALTGDPGTGRPMLTPTDKTTIPGLCKSALQAVDTDIKGHILHNVVVVGGSSLLPGLTARINADLSSQWPNLKVRLQSPGNVVERKYASWIGGSILASLGTFHQMWVSRKEYEEGGAGIVEKRCK